MLCVKYTNQYSSQANKLQFDWLCNSPFPYQPSGNLNYTECAMRNLRYHRRPLHLLLKALHNKSLLVE